MGGEFPGPEPEEQAVPAHLQSPESRVQEAARKAGINQTAAEIELERQQRFTSPEGRAQDMMRKAARRNEEQLDSDTTNP